MSIVDLIVGKPLKTSEERAEQIGPAAGIPIFGLDALSSAAYGPEAALSLLIPLGLAGVHYILPVSAAIITLLMIVYFSYRQTIAAYPTGGGSYTVARFNLGTFWGLLAGAALMGDYVLTAAVGISAGVGALISAAPKLLPHTLSICLFILVLITIVNLRGVREAGVVFMIPTYLFVGTLLITIVGGLLRVLMSGGHPVPALRLPSPPPQMQAVTNWLLLRVFASGCTALTGVEAVSNGVRAFREPGVKNAQRTLTVIIAILAILLAGISYLVNAYGIVATSPGQAGYAVGAFLAFTLSQAGMVRHWGKVRGPHWVKSALVNGLGALVTGITVIVVMLAKFKEGAWITLVVIPLVMLFFHFVRGHYHRIALASKCTEPLELGCRDNPAPLVVVPVDRWSQLAKQALEFACRLSDEIIAVHVEPGEHSTLLKEEWERYVAEPHRRSGSEPPTLTILASPYRFVVLPIVQFVLELAAKHPEREVVVVIPEFVEDRWYEYFLHNQRSRLLEWTLLARGNERISTMTTPYYLPPHLRRLT